jgi:hypothetical protein
MSNAILGIIMIISTIILLVCYVISCTTTNEIVYKISTGLAIVSLFIIMSISLSYTEN